MFVSTISASLIIVSTFFVFGILIFSALGKTDNLKENFHLRTSKSFLIICLLSIVTFWVFYINSRIYSVFKTDLYLGEIFCFCVVGGSWIWFFRNLKALRRAVFFKQNLVLVLVFILLKLFYLSFLSMVEPQLNSVDVVTSRLYGEPSGSADYYIMYNQAKFKLKSRSEYWASEPANDYYLSTSNERTPLLAGLYLLFTPYQKLVKDRLFYYILALASQLLVYCSIYSLLISLGLSRANAIKGCFLMSLTMYFFFGVTYATGKMLSGSLAIYGIISLGLLTPKGIPRFSADLYWAALFFACSFWVHTGIAFMFLPVAILLIYYYSKSDGLKASPYFVALGIFLLIALPYPILFSLNEPWGGGAIRFLIADELNRKIYENLAYSPFQAAYLSYKEIGLSNLLERKLQYLKYYASPDIGFYFQAESVADFLKLYIIKDFKSWIHSSFILSLSFLLFYKELFNFPPLGRLAFVSLSTICLMFFVGFSGSLSASIIPSSAVILLYVLSFYCLLKKAPFFINYLTVLYVFQFYIVYGFSVLFIDSASKIVPSVFVAHLLVVMLLGLVVKRTGLLKPREN